MSNLLTFSTLFSFTTVRTSITENKSIYISRVQSIKSKVFLKSTCRFKGVSLHPRDLANGITVLPAWRGGKNFGTMIIGNKWQKVSWGTISLNFRSRLRGLHSYTEAFRCPALWPRPRHTNPQPPPCTPVPPDRMGSWTKHQPGEADGTPALQSDLSQVSPPRFSNPWDEAGTQCPPTSSGLGSVSNAARLGESRSPKPHAVPATAQRQPRSVRSPRLRALPAIWETKASAASDMSSGSPAPTVPTPRGPQCPPPQPGRSRHLTGPAPAEARVSWGKPGGGGEDPKVTARPGQELPVQLTAAHERFRQPRPLPPPVARGARDCWAPSDCGAATVACWVPDVSGLRPPA